MTALLLALLLRNDADLAELLAGVSKIASPGVPGDLVVFGPDAFPVILGRAGDRVLAPVVAAARDGKGRIVAFGHTGYFDPGTIAKADTARFLANSVRWASGKKQPKVGVRGHEGLRKHLAGAGFEVVDLAGDDWTARLRDVHVVCVDTADACDALAAWVSAGGGLLWTTTGWGWLQLNPGRTLLDHPGNRRMARAGIVWSDGTVDPTDGEFLKADPAPTPHAHAGRALDALLAAKGELRQAGWTVTAAARALPPGDVLLLPKLKKLAGASAIPTEKEPLRDLRSRIALTMQLLEIDRLPPEKIQAHPASAHFPGAVPKSAKRVKRTIRAKGPGWHSTGLYAAPGDRITVTIPDGAKGLHVRIGCHTDGLWHHDAWKRAPNITLRRSLDAKTTTVASAFGGLLYLEGSAEFTIEGAVEAPLYVRGVTTIQEWKKIRTAPGPWAEIATSKVVVTVPSEFVRTLDDPEAVAEVWDRILDAAADLAGIPRDRERPERFVADVQISAGYMHSGYPIMTHLDAAPDMADAKKLLAGNWGLVHELGHNHQEDAWTFEGTGEVTNNVFSIYILEKVCSIPTRKGHPALQELDARGAAHRKNGARFDAWKDDPFLALAMYVQLREAFGWEPFQKVFAGYRGTEPPRTDQDKRDQWMVRFSRAIGKNLGPFFQAWGVPTTEAARKSIQDLPGWMPDSMK